LFKRGCPGAEGWGGVNYFNTKICKFIKKHYNSTDYLIVYILQTMINKKEKPMEDPQL